MNANTFNMATYIMSNGQLNFPNYMANLQLFVNTSWQRSKKENADGLKFFASIWESDKLVHRGATERLIKEEPKKEEKKKASKK